MMLIAGALALAPIFVAASAIGAASRHTPAAPLPPIPVAQWQPRAGDVIFRASEDLIGNQIRDASGGGAIYSHVGLVVDHGGRPMVVDVSPFGGGKVKFSEVAAFTTEAETTDLLVVRPRGAVDGARLTSRAERLAAAGIPFDYAFNMQDARELYCAELVYNLLGDAGVDLSSVEWSDMYVPVRGVHPLVTPDALAHAATLAPIFRRRTPPGA